MKFFIFLAVKRTAKIEKKKKDSFVVFIYFKVSIFNQSWNNKL